MFNNLFFFENCAVYEIMLRNAVDPDRPHENIILLRPIEFCVHKAKKTHTHVMFNTYCFSTATIFSFKRLIITLYVRCLLVSSLLHKMTTQ